MPGSPHPAIIDAQHALELTTHRNALDYPLHRLKRAILLSPTLEVCEALLRGERVPLSKLDPVWVRRYGIR